MDRIYGQYTHKDKNKRNTKSDQNNHHPRIHPELNQKKKKENNNKWMVFVLVKVNKMKIYFKDQFSVSIPALRVRRDSGVEKYKKYIFLQSHQYGHSHLMQIQSLALNSESEPETRQCFC